MITRQSSVDNSQRHVNGRQALVVAFSAVMITAVLWPVGQNWREDPRDGFPFSYYPMFTKKRRDETTITHLIGLDADGKQHRLSYKYAGTGGLNQVRKQLRKTVRRGGAEPLCRKVAWRVARRNEPHLKCVVSVAIVTGDYSPDDFFNGDRRPETWRIDAQYDVPWEKP